MVLKQLEFVLAISEHKSVMQKQGIDSGVFKSRDRVIRSRDEGFLIIKGGI